MKKLPIKFEKLDIEDVLRIMTACQRRLRKQGIGINFTMQSYPVDPEPKAKPAEGSR